MWTSTIPDDPVVARWWAERDQDRQVHPDPQPAAGVIDREEWRIPALAARVRRHIRDIDAALAACDRGYPNGCGCTYCQPDHRYTRPDYGIEGRSPVERRPCGPILSVR